MIHTSPFEPVAIPELPVHEVVLARAHTRGDRTALVDGATGRTVPYAALPGLVDRAAAGFAGLGLKAGDVCAVLSPNGIEFVLTVLALSRLGVVITTANPLYTEEEFTPQLGDSEARCVCFHPMTEHVARASARHAGITRLVSLVGDAADAVSFASFLDTAATPPESTVGADDLFALPYSSGTTGLPKGVMLTHRNIVANMLQLGRGGHLDDGTDTLIAFLPFFHIYGLTAILLDGVRCGATVVVMSRFDMDAYFALVKRHQATVLHVVPPIVLALAKHPAVNPADFASVRKLFSGAAPLSNDVIAPCLARLGCSLQQGYGLTEASPCTHMTPPGDLDANGTVGVCVADTECCVVDANGRRLGLDEGEGEVWVRGPQVMQGYLNKPDATRATLDDDGWLHTGDIARVDRRGYFTIVDRLKELIKYKGMQVAPAELEASLLSHPAVADAAVVPYPDAEAGEVPKAFVVLKGEATAAELIAHVAAHHAPHKKIRALEFIDTIPKSASGKILRRVLRDRPPAP